MSLRMARMDHDDGDVAAGLGGVVARALGREIAASRARKKWTQQQLADAVGMAQSSIKNYELGYRKPKVDYLVVLANALDADAGKWMNAAQDASQQHAGTDT